MKRSELAYTTQRNRGFKLLGKTKKYKLSYILFVLPAVLLNLIFFVYPAIKSLQMSFYDWGLLGEKTLIWIDNYKNLLSDTVFWNSLWFTAKYTLLVTPLIFVVAFCLALLINKSMKGVAIFRSIYFTPVIISMVASSLIWLWMYNDVFGLINYYLLQFGIINKSIVWMGSASTSLPAISLMITWKMSGFTMVILLAGLQSIPEEVYEASKVDGASKFKKIWYITIPLLKPTIGLALIVSVIGSVLAFEQFLIMTKGGPSSTTLTAVHYIYNTSFKHFHFGYGSSMTMILLIVLVLFSLLQAKLLRNPVDY